MLSKKLYFLIRRLKSKTKKLVLTSYYSSMISDANYTEAIDQEL